MEALLERSILDIQLEKIQNEAAQLDFSTLLSDQQKTMLTQQPTNNVLKLQHQLSMRSPETYFQLIRPKFSRLFDRHIRTSFR
ncbi:MAG: hypothetical protein ACFB15_27580 [Cyclobacteriaceae bacterium]